MIEKRVYGQLSDGKEIMEYTLINSSGTSLSAINYGAIVTAIKTKDKNGQLGDIVLGYDSLELYVNKNRFYGAVAGRYANRIANGQFTIGDSIYNVLQNNNGQHLHGGKIGFDKVFWNIEEVQVENGVAIDLTYASPDGEEGYPGNLNVTIRYTLTEEDDWIIEYTATTDKPTIINLTQHSYFDLSAGEQGTILDHELQLVAPNYLPVDSVLIPTGEIAPVAATPFDFRQSKPIGRDINADHDQLIIGGGYDHCWVMSTKPRDQPFQFAKVIEPTSGRTLTCSTTEPGVQLYTGNFLNGLVPGKGRTNDKRSGFCLETQHFPDSPNKDNFPTVILLPDDEYKSTTIYSFGVME